MFYCVRGASQIGESGHSWITRCRNSMVAWGQVLSSLLTRVVWNVLTSPQMYEVHRCCATGSERRSGAVLSSAGPAAGKKQEQVSPNYQQVVQRSWNCIQRVPRCGSISGFRVIRELTSTLTCGSIRLSLDPKSHSVDSTNSVLCL